MRCRYCNKRLNLFKSLGGSSFCSQEHQKLYEEAEANKSLERLLQFVEKDPKSGPAKPTVAPASSPFTKPGQQEATAPSAPIPPAAPAPQIIAANTSDTPAEPPMAEFLFDPIAPAVTALAGLNANFEIPEAGFQSDPPALPAFRFAIASADPQPPADGTPPPLASWSNTLFAIDAARTSVEVPSVSSVRPRAIEFALPSLDKPSPKPVGPSPLCPSDASGLQLAIQAVFDTRSFANLARLSPLPREARAAGEPGQWPAGKSDVAVLPRASALESPELPETKAGSGVTIGISAAMTRKGVGRNVPAPPARAPQLRGRLGLAAVSRTFPDGTQEPLSPGQHEIRMQAAMTRACTAKGVRQPQLRSSRLMGTLSSNGLNRISAHAQNIPGPGDRVISQATRDQLEFIVPPVESTAREVALRIEPATTLRNLTIRESDTALAAGFTDAEKPADVSSPLFVPAASARLHLLTIGINWTTREILARIQAQAGFQGCTICPSRQALRDCLRPVIPASAETRLGSAIASADWFHPSDRAAEAFASMAPASRVFSIRFEPKPFSMDMPTLRFDRALRRPAFEAHEGRGAEGQRDVQRLAISRSSRTSPLSLVTKPQPLATRLAVRYIAKLNRFTSMVNVAANGVLPSAASSASPDEHQPTLALPQVAASGLSLMFRLSTQGALKPPPIEAAGQKKTDNASRPHPSPLRVQPASMLVLPGLSIPVNGIRWRANSEWAIVASPRLAKQGDVQVSASVETRVSSLHSLDAALRIDSQGVEGSATLRSNPKPPAISLDLGDQTSAPGVASANALPRRSGPKLPAVSSKLKDVLVSGR